MTEAVGLVVCVLMELPEHARDGDLARVPDATLEQWAMWAGKPGRFAAAFRAELCTPQGVVRAWEKHNGAALRRAEQDLERKRAERDRRMSRGKSADRPQDVRNVSRGNSAGRPQEFRNASRVDETRRTTAATANAVAAVAREARSDGDGALVERALTAVEDDPHGAAVRIALRAAKQPTTLAGELGAWVDGMRGAPVSWATVARAVHELAVAETRLTPATLGAFIRRLEAGEHGASLRAPAPEDDAAVWDRLIAEANAKATAVTPEAA